MYIHPVPEIRVEFTRLESLDKKHRYPVPEIRVEFTRLESLEFLDENFAILNHLYFLLTAHSGEPCQAVPEVTLGA